MSAHKFTWTFISTLPALLLLAASAPLAFAQQPVAATTLGQAQVKPSKPVAAQSAAKSEKPATDSALRQRVDALEEQLADLQVAVGTIESFAKSNGAASASPAYRAGAPSAESTADTGKIAALDQQVRTLAAQVQALTDQVRTLSRGQVAGSGPVVAAAAPISPPAPPTPQASAPAGIPSFGTQTVTAADPDPINGLINDNGGSSDPAAAKQAYEAAYGYLLQQDFGAAESAFSDFLTRYPADSLAGNAQYWLGETYYARSQFKPAAAAFLKGYQTYGKSSKAPDSLLKLSMSLSRLGQKDAACSSLSELSTRFPAASPDVKAKAVSEKQRMGCI